MKLGKMDYTEVKVFLSSSKIESHQFVCISILKYKGGIAYLPLSQKAGSSDFEELIFVEIDTLTLTKVVK